jgi:hypothetical protein
LTVSVRSLLDRWEGPICILVGDAKALGYASRIVASANRHRISDGLPANVTLKEFEALTGPHAGYVNKTRLGWLTPFDSNVFLDADTIVWGDITPVFPEDDEIVLTQFAHWHTNGSRMKKRIMDWSEVEPARATASIAAGGPAINTGVIGFRNTARVMEEWHNITMRRISFICDEIAMQLIYSEFPNRVLDHRYNFSLRYGDKSENPIVMHFHGRKHLKDWAAPHWLIGLKRCREENFGQINEWIPAGDDRLNEFMLKYPI